MNLEDYFHGGRYEVTLCWDFDVKSTPLPSCFDRCSSYILKNKNKQKNQTTEWAYLGPENQHSLFHGLETEVEHRKNIMAELNEQLDLQSGENNRGTKIKSQK